MKYKQVEMREFFQYFSMYEENHKKIFMRALINGNSEKVFGNIIIFKIRANNFNPIAGYTTLTKNYKRRTYNEEDLLYYINQEYIMRQLLTQQ